MIEVSYNHMQNHYYKFNIILIRLILLFGRRCLLTVAYLDLSDLSNLRSSHPQPSQRIPRAPLTPRIPGTSISFRCSPLSRRLCVRPPVATTTRAVWMQRQVTTRCCATLCRPSSTAHANSAISLVDGDPLPTRSTSPSLTSTLPSLVHRRSKGDPLFSTAMPLEHALVVPTLAAVPPKC